MISAVLAFALTFALVARAEFELVAGIDDQEPPGVLPIISRNDSNFQIRCTSDCTLVVSQHLSAGGPDIPQGSQTPPGNLSTSLVSQSGFDFSSGNWLGASFFGFKAHVELDIAFTPSINDGNETRDVEFLYRFPTAVTSAPITGMGISFTAEWVLHGLVKSSRAFEVSTGFDVSLPDGSALLVSLAPSPGDAKSKVLDGVDYVLAGFDQAAVTLVPVQSHTPDVDASIVLSMRPGLILTQTGSDGPATFNTTFGIYPEIPAVETIVSQDSGVTESCTAPGPGSKDPVYETLTKIETFIGIGGVVSTPGQLGDSDGTTVRAKNIPAALEREAQPVQCYAFDAEKAQLVKPNQGGKLQKVPSNAAAARDCHVPRMCATVGIAFLLCLLL